MENSDSEEITKVTSGLCGPFTGYTLYSNGELVISGQGEIQKTDTGGYPWNYHKDKITSIVIGADVTVTFTEYAEKYLHETVDVREEDRQAEKGLGSEFDLLCVL
jgi:hypothetical protein